MIKRSDRKRPGRERLGRERPGSEKAGEKGKAGVKNEGKMEESQD